MTTVSWLGMHVALFFFRIVDADHFFYLGRLDYAKVRPLPLLIWASIERMELEQFVMLIAYIGVFIAATANASVAVGPVSVGLLLVGVAASTLIWIGLYLAVFSSVVWFTRVRSIGSGLAAFHEHTKYPLEILSDPMRLGVTILPLAFTAYYPVAFALRPAEFWLPGALALPVGLVMIAIGYRVFQYAVQRYESVGSSEEFGG